MITERTVPGEKGPRKQKETRYYISSLALDAELIASSVRKHWSVENNLHWQLDVSFNEDYGRKKNNAAVNFSLVSKTALSMLKHYVYITIEKYTIFQLKSIPVLIVCEDKKSYLNAG